MSQVSCKYEVKIALVFTLALMVAFFCFGAVRYEVNDDMAITALVKGLFGLAPGAEGVFISPFLGGVLFSLYKILPNVSWFSLFLYSGVVVSCFLGGLSILLAIRSVSGKIAGLAGVAFFLSLTAFQINFAAVSLLLWVTGCVYLLHSVRRGLPENTCFWLASSSLAVAYLLRPSLLPILLLLAVPLFFTLLLGGRRVALLVVSPLLVALTLSLLSGMVIRGGDDYSEYQEFNKIRSEFNDTSRSLRNAQTPQALFAAKWSNEDYLVTQNWWLHDSTFFNSEQITAFLEKNGSKSASFNASDMKRNFSSHIIYSLVILLWALVLLLANKPTKLTKIQIVNLLLYFFLIAVVLILMGIRFPPRIAYPCFLMLFLSSLLFFDDFQESHGLFSLKIVPPLLFVFFLIYSFAPIARQKIAEVEGTKWAKKYIDQSLKTILQTNGSDSVIVDVNPGFVPTNYFPFQENDPILKSRVMPFGWLVGTPAYLDFLQREGLGDRSTVVAKMIDNRRIVFRFWDSQYLPFEAYVKSDFLRHLRQRYTVPGSDRHLELKILNDHREGGNGLVYFQVVTVPDQSADLKL